MIDQVLARRSKAVVRYVTRRVKSAGRRRPKRSDLKHYAKYAGYGVLGGMAVSIPLTLAGRYFQRPELIEAGQRIGAIVAAKVGHTAGEAGFQVVDATFDRLVSYQGQGISGSQGQVYL